MTPQRLDLLFWVTGVLAIFDGMCAVVCNSVPELNSLTGLFVGCSLSFFFACLAYYMIGKDLEKRKK